MSQLLKSDNFLKACQQLLLDRSDNLRKSYWDVYRIVLQNLAKLILQTELKTGIKNCRLQETYS